MKNDIALRDGATQIVWQMTRLDISGPAHCLMLFKSNRDAGLILFAALVAEAWAHRI